MQLFHAPSIMKYYMWNEYTISLNNSWIFHFISPYNSYLEAGADTIITVTYQATVEGFQKFLPGSTRSKAEDLIKLGVRLAREACQEVPDAGGWIIKGADL